MITREAHDMHADHAHPRHALIIDVEGRLELSLKQHREPFLQWYQYPVVMCDLDK
jgi:hypothetical protein